MIAWLIPVSLALILSPNLHPLAATTGFGLLNATLVWKMIPLAAPALIKAGLKGSDRLKKDRIILPETLGVVVGVVYLFSLIVFIPFIFFKYLVTTHGGGTRDSEIAVHIVTEEWLFPHSKLSEYLSGLLSIQSMLMLGVADDLFDLRWRHKFFLPAVAAIPMLIVYYVDFGVTSIVLPPFLNMGSIIDLGWLYYVYMGCLAILCTNCINIYAGVNGLEVSQAVVLGFCALLNDLIYIFTLPTNNPAIESHLLSSYTLIAFIGASIPLLVYNWYPAKGFVGDTYCYLAGMVFAVVAILGHFSKTILSLFGPQIFNFIYSAPQLFHIVPCPRHRMPVLNEKTGLLEPSKADVTNCHSVVKYTLRVLAKLRLVKIYETEKEMLISNMTLINLTLVWTGPVREDRLTTILLILQAVWGITAVLARHQLAKVVFVHDNL